jgi:hypothetical protein
MRPFDHRRNLRRRQRNTSLIENDSNELFGVPSFERDVESSDVDRTETFGRFRPLRESPGRLSLPVPDGSKTFAEMTANVSLDVGASPEELRALSADEPDRRGISPIVEEAGRRAKFRANRVNEGRLASVFGLFGERRVCAVRQGTRGFGGLFKSRKKRGIERARSTAEVVAVNVVQATLVLSERPLDQTPKQILHRFQPLRTPEV